MAGLQRVAALIDSGDRRGERDETHDAVVVEQFIEGREFAVEGLMNHGSLDVLAIFDKPDPLDGPFFEETIYVTPSNTSPETQAAIVEAVFKAALAIGVHHGPIHAEGRVHPDGV